ncbi:MAG: cyclic nucleotide-binding domain-containing protein [Candidatus Binataceae bacterium]|nr:cyclic nucleotide-binding domain-containing protein [Candidatus Binataceae bacterium]
MRSITISDDLRNRLYGQLSQFLPEVLADELIRHHTAVTYAKGSVIFLQGSPADLMFWVLSGMVKVYAPRPIGISVSSSCADRATCWDMLTMSIRMAGGCNRSRPKP